MNRVTNFLEQLNNGSRWAFLAAPSTERDPWEAAGVPRDFPKHLAVSWWGFGSIDRRFGDCFHDCKILFSTVFGPGLGSTQPTNQQSSGIVTLEGIKRLNPEALFHLPLMLWLRVCGGRLHLLPYTGRGWPWIKRRWNFLIHIMCVQQD